MTSRDEDYESENSEKINFGDRGFFIGADGINPSVQWKISNYGSSGALSEQAIAEITESCQPEFTVTKEDLQRLSRHLGSALDGQDMPFLYETSRSDAKSHGVKKLEEIRERVAKAETANTKARKTMQDLAENLYFDRKAIDLRIYLKKLQEAEALLVEVSNDLSTIEDKDEPFYLKFKNRRHVPDARRRYVVLAVHQFLQETGNRYSFTTDVGSYERSGGLMDFLDLVVPHITDPPSKLSKDTVARDLTAMRQLPDINDD